MMMVRRWADTSTGWFKWWGHCAGADPATRELEAAAGDDGGEVGRHIYRMV